MVWGLVTSETPDSDKEICDYADARAEIQKWSDDTLSKTLAAGQDPSLGNMRVMHQLQIGGKAIKIEYKDAEKQVWVGSEPATEDVWHLLKGGFLTAHSIGGSYKWKRKEGEYTRYAPTIGEISYVDRGANPDASFSYVKADGSTELRKFAAPGDKERGILAKLHAEADRAGDVERITKAVMAELGTDLEKLRTIAASLVAQIEPTKGETLMTPEQLKKCAAALGISEADFLKLYAPAADLEKAKGGLAALHGHIEKAMGHHEEMHKAHGALAAMHEAHAKHLGKCDKACKAVMGSDEKEAEKALKALLSELTPVAAPVVPAAAASESLSKADVEKMLADQKAANDQAIADAVKKALDAAPAGDAADRTKLFAITRGEEVKKSEATAASDPLPV
jgi:hypothetical protein